VPEFWQDNHFIDFPSKMTKQMLKGMKLFYQVAEEIQ